jgi:DNA-binding beta-propeller fold protein YncE
LLDYLIGNQGVEWLLRPNGVVADSSGNIYVADSMRRAVFVFDIKKQEIRLLGKGLLQIPVGLALDNKKGIVYVSDSRIDKVFGIDINTDTLKITLGVVEKFSNPSGMVFDDSRDRLYIADTKNHIVRVYDEKGKPLFTIGSKGQEDNEFNFPNYLALDMNGRLFVVDQFNFKVKIFSPEGKFLKKFGNLGDSSGYFTRPAGLGVDSEGHVYLVDTAFNNFQIFDEDGKFYLHIGKSGKEPGEFSYPSGMFVDKNDRIFVTDTYNRRIQVFQYLKENK